VSTRRQVLAGAPNEEHFGFCQAIEHNGIIAISGQVGKDNATGEMRGPTTVENRVAGALDNVRTMLESLAGADARLVYLQAHVAVPLVEVWDALVAECKRSLVLECPAVSIVPVDGLSRPDYLVEVSAVATKQPVSSLADQSPIGSVLGSSRAVRVGDQVFLSGHLPVDAAGEVVGATVAEQFEAVLAALKTTLGEVGAAITDVISVHIWIAARPTPEGFEELAAVNRRFFGASKPTSTLVFVPELPLGALVQVSAVAIIGLP
jgi:enamine deaminase RidA (YjgF/YER057c/UK114 family)